MSRTDKHAPYWVQAAERGTHEYHRHELLGQPRTVQRKRKDDRGNILMEEYPVKVTIRAALGMFATFIAGPEDAKRVSRVNREAKRRRGAGASLDELIDGPLLRKRPVTDTVTIGHYADRCTIDETADRNDRLADGTYAPCFRTMNYVEAAGSVGRWKSERASGLNRPPRQEFRDAEEIPTRQLTRLANSGADLD